MLEESDPIEQLRAIRSMIAATRRSTARHWVYLLAWGVLGVVASLSSQFMVRTGREPTLWIVWTAYMIVGAFASLLFGRREERRTRVQTFAGRALSVTWAAIGVTIAMVCITAATLDTVPPRFLPGVIALLLAPGLCVMGALLEFGALYAAAVLWWVGGIVMMLRPEEAFTVQTALLVLGYLVPAELLRRQLAADDALD